MLRKLFLLSIIISGLPHTFDCTECFDFQCFDGGHKSNSNCFRCNNVSIESKVPWLKHLDQMIYIYKNQKRYETAKQLEIKRSQGMYCCSGNHAYRFGACSLTFAMGSKDGIPHYGMGCTTSHFLDSATCRSKSIGIGCCQTNHCNVPNDTELQFMMNEAKLIFPFSVEETNNEKYKFIIFSIVCVIAICVAAFVLFCIIKSFIKSNNGHYSSPNQFQSRPLQRKMHCLIKFFTYVCNYNRRKGNVTRYTESVIGRKEFDSTKMDSIDYLTCSGSGAGKPLMTKRSASTDISLVRAVGEGRFGTVWLGKWNGDNVAVKIFSTRDERSWLREKEIYQKNFLRHSNVLGYVATDSRDNGLATELWLVTDYHENGSLYDYLRGNVLTVLQTVKMIRSITNGLAHLHMEINGTELRPGIAHRDLKSRNILVKSCGECCIGDLGLAVRLNEDITAVDLSQVGTRRYMAPEVIRDNIVLSDSQYNGGMEAFKRADIYSYSLVLWEIVRCCACASMRIASSSYEMPYQSLVSNDPSIEEMKDIVCDKKIRPPLSASWDNLNPVKDIVKSIGECWFEEPASRLTIMRLKKLMSNAWNEVCALQNTVSDIAPIGNPHNSDSNNEPHPHNHYHHQHQPYKSVLSTSTLSSAEFPLSVTSNDIPNIAIRTRDNVLITDTYHHRNTSNHSPNHPDVSTNIALIT